MPIRLYSYARCNTCRQALAWLQQRGIDVQPVDITLQPPSLEELRQGLEQLGRKRLFNTSGQSYRALGSAAVQAMDDDQALAALAADGRLVKRPYLITAAGQVLTGFKPEEWQALLAG
jgi:arsenate reductase (glutaredoxin)